MPYEVKKSGKEYCVHKKSDGKKIGCHSSSAKAYAQIKARRIPGTPHGSGIFIGSFQTATRTLSQQKIRCPE